MTLTLVLIASLGHYSQVAVAKSNRAKGNVVVDGTVSVAAGDSSGTNTDLAESNNNHNLFPTNQITTTTNPLPSNNLNSLTSKELKSFSKCIDTANKIQGISGRIVTGCLDTSKGLTSTSIQDTTTSSPNISTDGNSNNPSATNQKTTISSLPSNNLNSLTSKELKSFSKCIDTANELHAASHAVFTGCLDEAKGRMY